MVQHRTLYRSPLCDNVPLSAQNLRSHVLETHGNFSDQQLQVLEAGGRGASFTFSAHDCPFCDDWAYTLWSRMDPKGKDAIRGPNNPPPHIKVSLKKFKCHAARHHEQLAISALPRHSNDNHHSTSRTSHPSTIEAEERPWQMWSKALLI